MARHCRSGGGQGRALILHSPADRIALFVSCLGTTRVHLQLPQCFVTRLATEVCERIALMALPPTESENDVRRIRFKCITSIAALPVPL